MVTDPQTHTNKQTGPITVCQFQLYMYKYIELSAVSFPRSFHWGSHDRRSRAVVGFLAMGQQPPPHRLWGLGGRCELPQRGSGQSPDRPKVFHCFQHSGSASPDIVILLTVDYHAAIGGKDPVPPAPLRMVNSSPAY